MLKEPEWNVKKLAISATDEDFELTCSSMGDAVCEIVVEPMMNTFEDYICGFTADSAPQIKMLQDESSPIEGRLDRRGGEPLVFKIQFEPNAVSGEFVAHLCFILPEEKAQSKYFEIKGIAT